MAVTSAFPLRTAQRQEQGHDALHVTLRPMFFNKRTGG